MLFRGRCGLFGIRFGLVGLLVVVLLLAVVLRCGDVCRDRCAGILSGKAVALHFLGAQLRNDGSGNKLGHDVELAVLQLVVDDEANQGGAVHYQAQFLRLAAQIGFGFTGQGGVVAEQALVVVGVHQHGVQRRGVFLAGAHHLFAAHLLFGLFRNLNGADRGIEELIAHLIEAIFYAAFEFREKPHV